MSTPHEQVDEASRPRAATRRAAIVGLSWIGADRAAPATDSVLGTAIPFSHASAIAAVPGLQLVAVCDVAAAAREAFASRWRGQFAGLRMYETVADLLSHEQIDVLSVVTPDDRHTDVVLAAIAAGVPAIFCEKPLATSLADADRIIDAGRQAGTVINVNHTRRWSPDFRLARRLATDGAVGTIGQIINHQGGPRAMLYRNGSHFLDLMTFLAGAEPEWVVAELDADAADYGAHYAGDGGHDPASEPGYSCLIAYANGIRGFVLDSKHVARDWEVTLLGTTGSIRVGAGGVTLRQAGPDGEFTSRPAVPRWTVGGMQAALLDLLAALDNGTPPASPPETARTAIALAEAILRSHAQGNVRVTVDRRAAS